MVQPPGTEHEIIMFQYFQDIGGFEFISNFFSAHRRKQ